MPIEPDYANGKWVGNIVNDGLLQCRSHDEISAPLCAACIFLAEGSRMTNNPPLILLQGGDCIPRQVINLILNRDMDGAEALMERLRMRADLKLVCSAPGNEVQALEADSSA